MTKTQITFVGDQAISSENILILFDDSVTADMKDYTIVQERLDSTDYALKKGSQIRFDEEVYQVVEVGPLANQNLNNIGHANLFFQVKNEEVANGIFLTPEKMPEIKVGTKIIFE